MKKFFSKKTGTTPKADTNVSAEVIGEENTDVNDASDVNANGKSVEKKAKKVEKPKRRRYTMAGVLHESVVETVMEQGFAQNTDFIYKGRYVGLFFDTAWIGGLTRKSSKDEAKGSIVENINSGRMYVLITAELMDIECMVIVPDAQTIDCMDEYSILRDVEYPLCYVSDNGDVEITDIKVTIDKIQSIIMDDKRTVAELFGDTPVVSDDDSVAQTDFVSDDDNDNYDDDASYDDVDNDTSFFSDDDMLYDESEDEAVDEAVDKTVDTPFLGSSSDWDDAQTDSAVDDNWSGIDYGQSDMEYMDESSDEEEEEDEEIEDISQEEYESVMKRKLYSDDLDLEITTEAFDSQFLHMNSFVPFNESRGAGWINGYLEQMSRDANADMRRLHQDNLLKMRTTYFNMISLYCSDVAKLLDYTDDKTEFGQIYMVINRAHEESMNKLDSVISDKKNVLEKEWQEKLAEVGNAASNAAVQQYRDRHENQYKAALLRVESDEKARVIDEFNDNLRKMHDDRRRMALQKLDMGINSALSEVSRMYQELLDEENARYKEHQKALIDFIDANRKDEVVRSEVLADELAQNERADAVRAEYTAKIQQLTADFEARSKILADELAQTRKQSASVLADKDNEYRDKLRKSSDETATLQARIDNLIEQISHLDEKKDAEYRMRMDDLIGEREAFSQKYDHLVDMQKKGSLLAITFAAVGVITALVIGFVAGEYVNIKGKSQEAKQQLSDDIDRKLENMEFDLPDGWSAEVSEDGNVTIIQNEIAPAN